MSVVIIEPEGGSGDAGLRGVTGEENNKEDLRQTDRQADATKCHDKVQAVEGHGQSCVLYFLNLVYFSSS